MFGTLGMPELILIFVVALLLFGPRKMPQIGKTIGRALGEFRRASNEFKRTVEDEIASEEIREVENDLRSIGKAPADEMRRVGEDIKNLGKVADETPPEAGRKSDEKVGEEGP